MPKPVTIADYIATFPEDVQEQLEKIRGAIRKAAPRAEEAISYGIPTFKLQGKSLIHFSGAKKHLALYPFTQAMAEELPESAAYDQSGKGTIRFPLGARLPLALITKITKLRLHDLEGKKPAPQRTNTRSLPAEIQAYNDSHSPDDQATCSLLAREIDQHLPEAERKIWHAHPVWFLDGNPIVGYSKLKDSVRLLFWSGRSFDEPDLKPEGKFQAAEARFTSADQVNRKDLQRWLEKSKQIQWDYKNIVKRKGVLLRLK